MINDKWWIYDMLSKAKCFGPVTKLILLRTYLMWRKVRDTVSFVTIFAVTILEEIVTI